LPQLSFFIILYDGAARQAGAPFMDVRIVAILVGVAITFIFQNGLDSRWYVSVPAGVIGYVVASLIRWAINERIRHNRTKQRDPIVK
jgi:hypothetical protein